MNGPVGQFQADFNLKSYDVQKKFKKNSFPNTLYLLKY